MQPAPAITFNVSEPEGHEWKCDVKDNNPLIVTVTPSAGGNAAMAELIS